MIITRRRDGGFQELLHEPLRSARVCSCQSAPKSDPLSASKIGSDALLMTMAQDAPMTRAWRSSSFPRPYIWRLTSLSLQI